MSPTAHDDAPVSAVTACRRCGLPCRVASERHEDARVLRKSLTPDGVCANCAITGFLRDTTPLNVILDRQGPDVLLLPTVQAQIGRILDAGNSDADLSEIDWNAVIAAWDLPVAKGAGYG